ncbi:hypothetical protein BOTCAL_0036g00140 [Botryotinia calthae]|uniref:Uncharacterized protein n=1 Tax=Botryotinia calthae TaxID=38488 RepID=A0A4Y8DCI3_9HELO|nr:hypothetical protein BOTCAL_0036g00140 [Botryotinia calthae]
MWKDEKHAEGKVSVGKFVANWNPGYYVVKFCTVHEDAIRDKKTATAASKSSHYAKYSCSYESQKVIASLLVSAAPHVESPLDEHSKRETRT